MRILVVTGGYPPAARPSADLACRGLVEGLTRRGHDVSVLAGGAFPGAPLGTEPVLRRLVRDRADRNAWSDVFRKELANQAALRESILGFRPAAALFFGLPRISASLPLLAESLGVASCLYVDGDSLAVWERDLWYREQPRGPRGRRAIRFLTRRFGLSAFPRPLHELPAVFTSRYVLEATERVGKPVRRAAVFPPGVDLRRFPFKETAGARPVRMLFLGPVTPEDGADVAVRTLGLLKRDPGGAGLTLTVAGPLSGFSEILASLQDRAEQAGAAGDVSFVEYAPDMSSPDMLLGHDLFLHPAARVGSITPALLEAMACGLPVVAAARGGNSEVLEDGRNALVVPPENPEACARAVRRLLDDPALREMLRRNARKTIEERFRLDRTVEAVEKILEEIAADPRPFSAVSRDEEDAAGGEAVSASGRPERWLRWSGVLIRIRRLFRPKAVAAKLKGGARIAACRLSLLAFPPVLKGIHRWLGRRRSRPAGGEPREVLVVQLADLGDIVLSGPFLRNLRTLLPRSKIVLAVHPGGLNIIEKCPEVDEILTFPYRSFARWNDAFYGSVRWWLKGLTLAVRTFRKRRFDLAVSLRWNNDAPQAASLILMAASGAPRRVAYLNPPNAPAKPGRNGLNGLITDGPARGAEKHEVEYQADLLRHLGGRSEDASLKVWTTADDEQKARNLLDGHRIGSGELVIAFAPGARWEFRRWPAERFVALGRWLQDVHGARIVILAAKSETALAAEIERGLKPEGTVNLAGKTTIRETAAVLRSCRYFVGNDSGPMHIAVAAGVVSVGLFGPGEYARFRPWGPAHAVVHLGLTCNPCSQNCLFSEARCIQGISVAQVQDIMTGLLGSPSLSGKAVEDEQA